MRKGGCLGSGVRAARGWALLLYSGSAEDLGLATILFCTETESFHNLLKKGEYKNRHVQKQVGSVIFEGWDKSL